MLSSALRQTSRALARAPPLPALGALGGARGMALSAYVTISTGIEVDRELKRIVDEVIIPGTGVAPELFWRGFAEIVIELGPRNRAELDVRDRLQKQIDAWHVERRGQPHQHKEYRAFLEQIGYILESTSDKPVQITTEHVDTEIATLAGPQLVCPVDNARFIVNAANARWGSLLDALYGTDVVPGPRGGGYSAERGAAVFTEAHKTLDKIFPLASGVKWESIHGLCVDFEGELCCATRPGCNTPVFLLDPNYFVAFRGDKDAPTSLLLRNHGLHVELCVDRAHPVGKTHKAGVYDIQVESALTAICDAEDSACPVDAADKIITYLNWNGLMTGELSVPMEKGGKSFTRHMEPDRTWTSVEADKQGTEYTLPGRALLLCRNVGLHMYTDVVRMEDDGSSTPEHFLDAAITALAATKDMRGPNKGRNSRTGSIYIVKPKMHAPDEVALVSLLFSKLERLLSLPQNTIKMGVMDEERRCTVNLPEMMRQAEKRLVFINTGFLDRTGDEIHTSMEAGPVLPKADLKKAIWNQAYELANVATGLAAGMLGRGQIGKGMWAAPDNMAQMMREKIAHLQAGASCAWVPSPTAATLHALHYHQLSVRSIQDHMINSTGKTTAEVLDKLIELPLLVGKLTADEVQNELENNSQALLGYVSRWVGQGVGCSKVNDIHHVALMEDRATLRINAQHIANWMHHGVTDEIMVLETMRRMATLVDSQNASDSKYHPMAPGFNGPEWKAALELVFGGRNAPNGYTEFTLTKWRKIRKAISVC